MRSKTYDVQDIAEKIASGHAFEDHVLCASEKKHWEKYGVKTRSEFKQFIALTLLDSSTKVFQSIDRKDIYHNKFTKTFISVDHTNSHGGTCFSCGEKYFETQVSREYRRRVDEKIRNPRVRIKTGGYNALYKGKNLDHKSKIKLDRNVVTRRRKILLKDFAISKEITKKQVKQKTEKLKDSRTEAQKNAVLERKKLELEVKLKQFEAKAEIAAKNTENEHKRIIDEKIKALQIAREARLMEMNKNKQL